MIHYIAKYSSILYFNRRKFYDILKIYTNLYFSNSAVSASLLLTKSTGGCSSASVIRLYSKQF